MGGEKADMEYNYSAMKGSPPRGRGKEILSRKQNGGIRITPAWAGKSKALRGTVREGQDHPRVGGEK